MFSTWSSNFWFKLTWNSCWKGHNFAQGSNPWFRKSQERWTAEHVHQWQHNQCLWRLRQASVKIAIIFRYLTHMPLNVKKYQSFLDTDYILFKYEDINHFKIQPTYHSKYKEQVRVQFDHWNVGTQRNRLFHGKKWWQVKGLLEQMKLKRDSLKHHHNQSMSTKLVSRRVSHGKVRG